MHTFMLPFLPLSNEAIEFFTPPKLIDAEKQAFPINVEEELGGEESLPY